MQIKNGKWSAYSQRISKKFPFLSFFIIILSLQFFHSFDLFISIIHSELFDADPTDFISILKPDQKNFISDVIDVRRSIQQSHDFRNKFDFFLRVNKLLLNAHVDKTAEALDQGKQQALRFQNRFMHCEQFNPIEN